MSKGPTCTRIRYAEIIKTAYFLNNQPTLTRFEFGSRLRVKMLYCLKTKSNRCRRNECLFLVIYVSICSQFLKNELSTRIYVLSYNRSDREDFLYYFGKWYIIPIWLVSQWSDYCFEIGKNDIFFCFYQDWV